MTKEEMDPRCEELEQKGREIERKRLSLETEAYFMGSRDPRL